MRRQFSDEREPVGKRFEADFLEIPLGAPVAQIVIGGGGKFLLMLQPSTRKILVYDVHELEMIGEIPVAAEQARIAAGNELVVVGYPAQNLIQTFGLPSLKRIHARNSPIGDRLEELAMGPASSGHFLVIGSKLENQIRYAFYALIDAKTMTPISQMRAGYRSHRDDYIARASDDGMVFVVTDEGGQNTEFITIGANEINQDYPRSRAARPAGSRRLDFSSDRLDRFVVRTAVRSSGRTSENECFCRLAPPIFS